MSSRANCRLAALKVALVLCCAAQAQQRLYVNDDAADSGDGFSWATALRDLQAALAAARLPDSPVREIWVAAGVYKPDGGSGDQSLSFHMIDQVAVLGGFAGTETGRDQRDWRANVTILSGDLNGDDLPNFGNVADNSSSVVTCRTTFGGAGLDGFTISGGYNRNTTDVLEAGGGLRTGVSGGPALELRNCCFRRNYSKWGGGLAHIGIFGGAFVVQDCEFSENGAQQGGAIFTGRADGAQFVRCRIENNSAVDGAGVYAASNAHFVDCIVKGNRATSRGGGLFTGLFGPWTSSTFVSNTAPRGAGAYVTGNSASFANCWFLSNAAANEGGGLLMSLSAGTGSEYRTQNCIFIANSAGVRGGAIAVAGSGSADEKIAVANGTLVSNTSAGVAGGIALSAPSELPFVLSNSIVRNNADASGMGEAGQLSAPQPGQLALNYCNVLGLTGMLGGTGNIDADARFWNPAGPDGVIGTLDDDLRLRPASPCIDAAGNALVLPDFANLDGDMSSTEPTPLDAAGYPRFRDDLFTTDTGSGTPPIVDMGAFEYRPIGDLNCDNAVNNFDVDPLILAISDPVSYAGTYPTCDRGNADINGDGSVNNFDIDPFVALLTGG